jgi:ankyrin repeat protein
VLSLPAELLLQIADGIGTADLNALVCTHPRIYATLNGTLHRRVLGFLYLPPSVLVYIASHLSVPDHSRLTRTGRFFHQHLNTSLYKRGYKTIYIPDPWIPMISYAVEQRGRESPLWWAMEKNCIPTMEKLLAAGAPAEVRFWVPGATLLSHAASHGRTTIVRLLLGRGANPNGAFPGQTPLHRAAQFKNVEMARMLLEYGADIEGLSGEEFVVPGMGQTPYQIAIENGAADIAILLLANGADPQFVTASRRTMDWEA